MNAASTHSPDSAPAPPKPTGRCRSGTRTWECRRRGGGAGGLIGLGVVRVAGPADPPCRYRGRFSMPWRCGCCGGERSQSRKMRRPASRSPRIGSRSGGRAPRPGRRDPGAARGGWFSHHCHHGQPASGPGVGLDDHAAPGRRDAPIVPLGGRPTPRVHLTAPARLHRGGEAGPLSCSARMRRPIQCISTRPSRSQRLGANDRSRPLVARRRAFQSRRPLEPE